MTRERLTSTNPATGERLWEGPIATASEVDTAMQRAASAFEDWSARDVTERARICERFAALVSENADSFAAAISAETGKALWDAKGETAAVSAKAGISLKAYHDRTGLYRGEGAGGVETVLRHRPHGVMAVLGPFNFPAHLPNGHIIPALLAGNTVVLKPSEKTPSIGERMAQYWREAGLPEGVLSVVHGGRETAEAMIDHDRTAGVLFTGSAAAGQAIHRRLAGRIEVIAALELGGNNPLVAWDVADTEAAVRIIIQSAYLTTGQRCTCARRLILPQGPEGDALLHRLLAALERLHVAMPDADPQPFMGSLIDAEAASRALAAQRSFEEAGANCLKAMESAPIGPAFLTPGLADVTAVTGRPDEEIFAPFLQVIRVATFDAAIAEANNTRYGLAAGLLTDDDLLWQRFEARIRAGIVNRNRATTGASSAAPFGGIGKSGNHRPSAYYAADYSAWPMAGVEMQRLSVDNTPLPTGMRPAEDIVAA